MKSPSMRPEDYDAWYDTPRGRWIGDGEFRLLHQLTAPKPHETVLDVGCGTGWFTRRFAAGNGWNVTGLDNDAARLAYARSRGWNERYQIGDACSLPFADASMDIVVSVTALCFIEDWHRALHEMVRVARRRIAIGVLNRHSLLWWKKGRHGGTGGYFGAHGFTATELGTALTGLPLNGVTARSALFLPGGGMFARACEPLLPKRLPWGSFLVIAADKTLCP